jgi:Fe2+ transport protein
MKVLESNETYEVAPSFNYRAVRHPSLCTAHRGDTTMKRLALVIVLVATSAFGPLAPAAEQRKASSTTDNVMQNTVVLGRNSVDNMIVTFELEPAKSMWLQTGNPPKWREHIVRKGERFHLDVKPVDPASKTVISYAEVTYKAVNRTNGKRVSGVLHPIWDDSGLHYAANSTLAGDGDYEIVVAFSSPTFGRVRETKDVWLKPVTTRFNFKIQSGTVVQASDPSAMTKG